MSSDLEMDSEFSGDDSPPHSGTYPRDESDLDMLEQEIDDVLNGPDDHEQGLINVHHSDSVDSFGGHRQQQSTSFDNKQSRKWKIVLGAAVSIFFLIIIIAIASYNGGEPDSGDNLQLSEFEKELTSIPSVEQALDHLEKLTSDTAVAGTSQDLKLAQWVRDQFLSFGFLEENVELKEYEVLLQYPVSRSLRLLSGGDIEGVKYPYSPTLEEPQLEGDNIPTDVVKDAIMSYNAYSKPGNVTAPLIYVNHGTEDDYLLLQNAGYTLTGRVAIARYGGNFRGLKAMLGERFGIAGLLIYSDPQDDGFQNGKEYPAGPYRPKYSVQRGSAAYISEYSGDPLTPGVAAIAGVVPEYTAENAPSLPQIPILPLSWGDAEPLLRSLGGTTVAEAHFSGWQGGLDFTYRIGQDPHTEEAVPAVVELEINSEYNRTTIWDVVATIPGYDDDEKDQEILFGNHRDAWVSGAVDPHSGTTVLLEVARSFGTVWKAGKGSWKPKRTLRFCSWDAEEFGLLGSVEYVEERITALKANAVAYINVDIGVNGGLFRAQASPLFTDLIEEVTKQVNYPGSKESVYHVWKNQKIWNKVNALGSGSDYTPFLQHAGISALDVRFISEGAYGVYHSIYDDYHWMTTYGDPGMKFTVTLAKIVSLIAYRLTSSTLLPMNIERYVDDLEDYVEDWEDIIEDNNIEPMPWYTEKVKHFQDTTLSELSATSELIQAVVKEQAAKIGENWEAAAEDKDLVLALNQILRAAEQKFLSPPGEPLPKRQLDWYRHVVFAPSFSGGYAASVFPGVSETLVDVKHNTGNWNLVKTGLSQINMTLDSARSGLQAEYDELNL